MIIIKNGALVTPQGLRRADLAMEGDKIVRIAAAIEPGGEGNSPDCAAVLCWHKNSVENALGQVKFFEDEGNPQYYGDIYSALVRMGGRIRREDQKGVVAIVQDLVTEAWKTGEEYKADAFVTNDGKTYVCVEDHTASAAFATDAAKWEEIV